MPKRPRHRERQRGRLRRPDYVAPHRHSSNDFDGLDALLFPPTYVAVATTAGPTIESQTFATIPEMDLTAIPPSINGVALWEARVSFTGTFSIDEANVIAAIRLLQGTATEVANSRFRATSAAIGWFFPLSTFATVVIPASTAGTRFRVQWCMPDGVVGEVLTAAALARRLEVRLRPYAGAAT